MKVIHYEFGGLDFWANRAGDLLTREGVVLAHAKSSDELIVIANGSPLARAHSFAGWGLGRPDSGWDELSHLTIGMLREENEGEYGDARCAEIVAAVIYEIHGYLFDDYPQAMLRAPLSRSLADHIQGSGLRVYFHGADPLRSGRAIGRAKVEVYPSDEPGVPFKWHFFGHWHRMG